MGEREDAGPDGSAPGVESVPAGGKRCRQCALAIPAAARLCHHCNAHQDWRGHLSLSGSVLALLVALVSVLSTAVPVLMKAMREENSRLDFSLPTSRQGQLFVIASNLGTRPGVIDVAEASVRIGDEILLVVIDESASSPMILPGSTQLKFRALVYRPRREYRRDLETVEKGGLVSTSLARPALIIHAREFDGTPVNQRIELSPARLRLLYRMTRSRCLSMPAGSEHDRTCNGLPARAGAGSGDGNPGGGP